MVVVKFLVFVSEVVSKFSKILTWIIGGAKGYLCPTNSIIGGRVPRLPPKSTPMRLRIIEIELTGNQRGNWKREEQWRAEAVGCPGPTRFLDALENIFYSSRKISDDLFYQLSNFRTIRSLDAPSRAASCPCNDIFLFIFSHLPTFCLQNWPLGCPPEWMPGAVSPSAPALHATDRQPSICIQCRPYTVSWIFILERVNLFLEKEKNIVMFK